MIIQGFFGRKRSLLPQIDKNECYSERSEESLLRQFNNHHFHKSQRVMVLDSEF
jgi:hypothetical protein